jgi:hypothetical protein
MSPSRLVGWRPRSTPGRTGWRRKPYSPTFGHIAKLIAEIPKSHPPTLLFKLGAVAAPFVILVGKTLRATDGA